MIKLLLIALGGATGALLRYVISGICYRLFGEAFPWGTLAANLTGCFAIGLLWAFTERTSLPAHVTPLLFTGVLGAFTTFSTYSLESVRLLREGNVGLALGNILGSTLLGLALVFLGIACAHYLLGPAGSEVTP